MTPFRKAKDTPAEQLLRVIEGSPMPTAPGATTAKSASPLKWLVERLHALLAGLAQLVLPAQREADSFLWNLRVAHRVLWVVLAGLGAYLALDVLAIRPTSRLASHLLPPSKADAAPAPSVSAGPSLRALSEYLAAAQRRNPFTGTVATAAKAASKTTKKRLADLAGDLVVVGIDRGANPIALVEQTSQQHTYMLKVGDTVNGMTVKSITPDGVVVTYEGEELTLK